MKHPDSITTLAEFSAWWLALPAGQWNAPRAEVKHYGPLTALKLYSEGPFQVELVVIPPGNGIPAKLHRHPDVDSIQVHVANDMFFATSLDRETAGAILKKSRPLRLPKAGRQFFVDAELWHALRVDPELGGSFWNIQKWRECTRPTTTGQSWEGEPLDAQHASTLQSADQAPGQASGTCCHNCNPPTGQVRPCVCGRHASTLSQPGRTAEAADTASGRRTIPVDWQREPAKSNGAREVQGEGPEATGHHPEATATRPEPHFRSQ